MTWSVQTQAPVDASEVVSELRGIFSLSAASMGTTADDVDQFDAAMEALDLLTPVVGSGPVTVLVSGHSNPHRTPVVGSPHDSVTIIVTSGRRVVPGE